MFQHGTEVGRAGNQRAIAVLGDRQVAQGDIELAPQLLQLVPATERRRGTLTVLRLHEDGEKPRPTCRILVQHPDHGCAALAQLGGGAVDGGNDVASPGHLDGRARRDKRVLHVDDHERRALRFQSLEKVQPSAPRQDPLDDLAPDRDLVHQNFSTQGRKSTSKLHAERCCRYTAM